MADLLQAVKSMLAAMHALGRGGEAKEFEIQFGERNWQIQEEDVARVSSALATPSPRLRAKRALKPLRPKTTTNTSMQEALPYMDASVPKQDSASTQRSMPAWLEQWSCLHHLSAFASVIPDAEELLLGLQSLAIAKDRDHVRSALQALFVEALGFDEKNLDVTPRLGIQKSLRHVETIAEYGDFTVLLVELSKEVPFTSAYAPVFARYPYALCIGSQPERGIVRFIYRHAGEGAKLQSGYRLFLGRHYQQSHNDNLLVWAYRLAQMRPKHSDDADSLRRRSARFMLPEPSDLEQEWDGLVPEGHSRIGPHWGELPTAELASFLQSGVEHPKHWGLQRVFEDRFPMWVRARSGTLNFLGYKIQGPVKNGTIRLSLYLELQGSSGETSEIELACSLFVPDTRGVFLIDGREWIWNASTIRSANKSAASGHDPFAYYEEDPVIEGEPESATEAENVESLTLEDEDVIDSDEDEPDLVLDGFGLRVLLETAVSRKLGGLAKKLWDQALVQGEPMAIFQCVRTWFNEVGEFQLGSQNFLLSALSPVAEDSLAKPERLLLGPGVGERRALPPAWACVEFAASEAPNTWRPVSGARLHPCGGLATPSIKETRVHLVSSGESALVVNPRCQGNHQASQVDWLHPSLANWSKIAGGQLPHPDLNLRQAIHVEEQTTIPVVSACDLKERRRGCPRCVSRTWVDANCGCLEDSGRESTEPTLWVSENYLHAREKSATIRQHMTVQVPHRDGLPPPVVFENRVGQSVRDGDVWAQIADDRWSLSKKFFPATASEIAWALRIDKDNLFDGGESIATRLSALRVPRALAGTVLSITARPIIGTLGATQSWVLQIVVAVRPRYRRARLPDGRIVAVRSLPAHSLLMGGGGSSANYFLSDPNRSGEPAGRVWSPEREEWIPLSLLKGSLAWLAEAPQRGPSLDQRPALISGSHQPATYDARMSEWHRRWLRVRDPECARHLDANEETIPGIRPWEPALGTLLMDLGLSAALPMVNASLVVAGPIRCDETSNKAVDLTRRRLISRDIHALANLGGLTYSCSCGELFGASRFGEECCKCHHVVAPSSQSARQWSCRCGAVISTSRQSVVCETCNEKQQFTHAERHSLERRHVALPVEIVHPWRLRVAATLLGLTLKELKGILESHGPTLVLAAARERLASQSWLRILQARFQRETNRRTAYELGRGYLETQALANADVLDEVLALSSVPVLPDRFLVGGFPTGSNRLLHGSLTERYRVLLSAIQQTVVSKSASTHALSTASQFQLQATVCELYGISDGTESNATDLASLVRHIWQSSRPADTPTTVPGLVENDDGLWLAVQEKQNRDAQKPLDETIHRYPIPTPLPTRVEIGSETSWTEKHARDILLRDYFPLLLGACASLDHLANEDERIEDVLEEAGVPSSGDRDRYLARNLLLAFESTTFGGTELINILTSRPPLQLPADARQAVEQIESRLLKCFHSGSEVDTLARVTLVQILGGWAQGPHSLGDPLGWRWIGALGLCPEGWRRVVPRFNSAAWRVWPAMLMFLETPSWLLGSTKAPPLLLALQGFSSSPLQPPLSEVPVASGQNAASAPTSQQPQGPNQQEVLPFFEESEPQSNSLDVKDDTTEPDPMPSINARVYEGTRHAWLQRLRSEMPPGDEK